MKQSKLFTKTQKEAPKDEVSKNAQLLIRAGYVDKLMAGVYTFLPLGWRVMDNISNIIRDEMEKAGGVEIFMPTLQPKENWEKTGRWEAEEDLFKMEKANGGTLVLGPTHEEVISPILKKFVSSYKDLPLYIFQFQNKFRNEKRAKSGILRGREFMMKDLYSFHTDEKDLEKYYEIQKEAYRKIFEKAGIGEKTYLTYASGGTFAKYSHEFQTITEAGEDIIHICSKCRVAVNKEIIDDLKNQCPECGSADLKTEKSAEVGNIFKLGTKYSKPFNLSYKDEKGEEKLVIMGCYGIGLSRLMGVIAEVYADEKGIVWPESVAPFRVHLLSLNKNEDADEVYELLTKNGVEVLYDDRDASAGEKFADADLIGIPYQVIISEKNLKEQKAEIKNRQTGKVEFVNLDKILEKFKA